MIYTDQPFLLYFGCNPKKFPVKVSRNSRVLALRSTTYQQQGQPPSCLLPTALTSSTNRGRWPLNPLTLAPPYLSPRFLFFLLLLLLCFCASSLLLLLTFCRLSPIPSRMLSFLLSPLSLLSLLFLLLPLMKHSHHFIENQKFRMQQADNLPFVYQSFRDMVISRNATCYNYKEWRQRWKLSFSRGWTKKSCGCWGCVT